MGENGLPLRRINDYIRLKSKGVSPNSVRTYVGHLSRFANWLADNKTEIDDLDIDHLARYANYLAGSRPELGASSCIDALGAVDRYIHWSITAGVAPEKLQSSSPAALYNSAKARRGVLPQVITPNLRFIQKDAAKKFLWAIGTEEISGEHALRNQLMARLMLESGLRVSEAIRFPISACPALQEQRRPNLASVLGKGTKQRFVIIPWQLQKDLMDYEEIERRGLLEATRKRTAAGELFLSARGCAVTAGRIQSLFRLASTLIGIKVTPHMLRHTYATFDYLRNRDLVRLQKVLGHSDSDTTQRYVGLAVLADASNAHEDYLETLEPE